MARKNLTVAESFARWLSNWFFEKIENDEYIKCVTEQIKYVQKHFAELGDDKLHLIFEKHKGAPPEEALEKIIRNLLLLLKYIFHEKYKEGSPLNNKKKKTLQNELKELDLEQIKSELLKIFKELCDKTDDIIEEVKEMGFIFEFDESCLPEEFEAEEYREKYKNAVKSVLAKSGIDDDVFEAAVIGLLLLDQHFDFDTPSNKFFNKVLVAIKELSTLTSYKPEGAEGLNWSALEIYKEEVIKAISDHLGKGKKISYHDFAATGREVVSNLALRKPDAFDYEGYIVSIFDSKRFCSGSGGGGGGSSHGGGTGDVDIELPPLSGDGSGSDEVVPENIRAIATIYMAYQLEQLQLIPAVDRIVELSMAGLLPYTYDNRLRIIDEYAWSQTDRLNEVARYSQFSRALGVSGGQVTQDVLPNNEFSERFRHGVSSIANFALSYDTQKPLNDRSEYVRKSIRDLAANASYYGWAGTYFVAERMKKHIDDAITILSLQQIQDAYGVTNMWQVIERVAQREFGITVNVVKHRTLAIEGKYILELIADKAEIWSGSTGRPLFTVAKNKKGDLVFDETQRIFRSAQYILAVEGYGDTQVDQYSQPVATSATPSLPSFGSFSGGGSSPIDTDKLKERVVGQVPNIDRILG